MVLLGGKLLSTLRKLPASPEDKEGSREGEDTSLLPFLPPPSFASGPWPPGGFKQGTVALELKKVSCTLS